MDVNEAMFVLAKNEPSHPLIEIEFFEQEENSSECTQKRMVATVEHVDFAGHSLLLQTGERIPFASIITVTGHILRRAQKNAR